MPSISPETRDHILSLVSALGREAVEELLLPIARSRHDYVSDHSAELSVTNFVTTLLRHPDHVYILRWQKVAEELVHTNPVPEAIEPVAAPLVAGPTMFSDGTIRIDASRGVGQEWGRLNDLHRASGAPRSRAPAEWLRTDQAQRLIMEQNGNSRSGVNTAVFCADDYPAVIRVSNGGTNPGTWGRWEMFTAYAEWLNPAFHLRVIREWREHTSGGSLRLQGIEDRLAGIERLLRVTPEELRESRGVARVTTVEPIVSDVAPELSDRGKVRAIVVAEGTRRKQLGEDNPYQSAWGYVYNLAGERPWGRGIRGRRVKPDSFLSAFEEAGRMSQLLQLVIEAYPAAYQSIRGQLGSVGTLDPVAVEVLRDYETAHGEIL